MDSEWTRNAGIGLRPIVENVSDSLMLDCSRGSTINLPCSDSTNVEHQHGIFEFLLNVPSVHGGEHWEWHRRDLMTQLWPWLPPLRFWSCRCYLPSLQTADDLQIRSPSRGRARTFQA